MQPILKFACVVLLSLAGLERASASSLTMSWSASASPSVTGYDVYYGTNSGNYPYVINAGDALSVTISNLTPGVTYYFAATAYDANGDQSAFSGEISFIIPGILTLSPSAAPGNPALLQFPVAPGQSYDVQASTDLINWSTIWQSGVMASNCWTQFTDPNAGQFPSRFYRLVLQ